jgi:hypothetical protein
MKITLESVRRRLLVIPLAAAALTIGCGDGALQSATGPSDISDSATFLAADAADSVTTASTDGEFAALAKGGGGNGKDKDKGKDAEETSEEDDNNGPGRGHKPDNGGGPGRSHEDKVVGFVSAKVGDSLTVRGITVIAGPNALIRHGHRRLTMDDIQVGDHLQARGAMEETTLVATEIKVQDTGNDNDDDTDEAELKGAIADLNLTTTPCPNVTFKIGATTVKTNSSTTFDDIACADLANGKVVEVEGTKQADGSVLAKKVEFEAGSDEVEGTVFEFSGASGCPAVTFKVGPLLSLATKVTTTSSTTFTGLTCATLANGAKVEVEGTKQADGSITAASVELK